MCVYPVSILSVISTLSTFYTEKISTVPKVDKMYWSDLVLEILISWILYKCIGAREQWHSTMCPVRQADEWFPSFLVFFHSFQFANELHPHQAEGPAWSAAGHHELTACTSQVHGSDFCQLETCFIAKCILLIWLSTNLFFSVFSFLIGSSVCLQRYLFSLN